MQPVPLSVVIAIGTAVAFYAMTIWAVLAALAHPGSAMGALAGAAFIVTCTACAVAAALAEQRRGNY